jgi:hypothetical protein
VERRRKKLRRGKLLIELGRRRSGKIKFSSRPLEEGEKLLGGEVRQKFSSLREDGNKIN